MTHLHRSSFLCAALLWAYTCLCTVPTPPVVVEVLPNVSSTIPVEGDVAIAHVTLRVTTLDSSCEEAHLTIRTSTNSARSEHTTTEAVLPLHDEYGYASPTLCHN